MTELQRRYAKAAKAESKAWKDYTSVRPATQISPNTPAQAKAYKDYTTKAATRAKAGSRMVSAKKKGR